MIGNGELLTGYAQVLGYSEVDSSFKSVMQYNYEKIYTSGDTTPNEVNRNVLEKIQSNTVPSANCQ